MPSFDKRTNKHEHKHRKEKKRKRKVTRSRSISSRSKSSNYSPDYSSSSAEHWHKANKRQLDKKEQSKGKVPGHLKKFENNWEHDRLEFKARKQQLIDSQQDAVNLRAKKNFNVNNTALAGIISEQKKTNARLDREEVNRANGKFKQIDHSDRQATLMSRHINQTEIFDKRQEYTYQLIKGQYVKIHKPYVCNYKGSGCGERFAYSSELEEHMRIHFINEAKENH